LGIGQNVFSQSEKVPELPFQRIQLNGYDVMPQPEQPLLMQHGQNTLSFWISNPFEGQSVRFSYQTRVQKDWISVDSASPVVLKNLPFEPTTIRIRAETKGQTRLNALTLVPQPFWYNWWFWPMLSVIALVLVSILVWLFFQYRLRQFMRLQNVRENIARDLHDDMGSYLGSISMLSQTVLNVAQKDPQQARLLVDKIGETARQVMDSMSDIVWAINPDNDSMAQIVVRMRDVATDLLGCQDVTLHQDIDEAVPHIHLPLEHRRDFFLIYKEALTNIAKYASATHVWVRLQRNGSLLMLTVQDDGVGFDIQQSVGRNPLGGNGVKNMHTRAQKLGGTLSIQSTLGKGTTVILQILVV
jgi:signal transduction histidine kinase